MNEAKDLTQTFDQRVAEEADETTWEAPDHTVVETALEVTGYYRDDSV